MPGRIAALFLPLIVVVASVCPAQIRCYTGPEPRTVSAEGQATIHLTPTAVRLAATIRVTASTATEAGSALASASRAARAAAAELGLKLDRGRSASYSIGEDRNWESHELLGYDASSTLDLILDDPEKLGEAIDGLLAAGVNEIGEVEFVAQNAGSSRHEALRAAFAAARAEAEVLAGEAGCKRQGDLRESEGSPERRIDGVVWKWLVKGGTG